MQDEINYLVKLLKLKDDEVNQTKKEFEEYKANQIKKEQEA